MICEATYSPEDNKLRLYTVTRLDPETYQRAKAAGFRWAPKQDLFFATWSPAAEDLALELAGEIGDEDTSLVERAEERADRFDAYRTNRRRDAEQAERTVRGITDGIPLGQPILVGHHSERHARRDAEKIDRAVGKAVKMWQTADYWRDRAAGALRHAKYKERPDVRARRIKKLEAEQRKAQRAKDKAARGLKLWSAEGLTIEQARRIAGGEYGFYVVWNNEAAERWNAWDVLRPDGERYERCPAWTLEQVQEKARAHFPRMIAFQDRWVEHYTNRLTYERAMLDESGYTPPPKRKTKAALPLLNYGGTVAYRNPYREEIIRGEAVGLTKAEWSDIGRDYKGTRLSECGTHRIRTAMVRRLGMGLHAVYLTDAKQHKRPDPALVQATAETEAKERERDALNRLTARHAPPPERPEADRAAALSGTTAQAVSAPALFPTPVPVAERMVKLAAVSDGQHILEPSAGTGRLIDAVGMATDWAVSLVAVEHSLSLAEGLRAKYRPESVTIHCADFLTSNDLGTFDRIIMNPPFTNGEDIKHITHALGFLKPGGRLVALCANGPRQARDLQPLADTWEPLPAGTFNGTGVRAALLVIEKGDA